MKKIQIKCLILTEREAQIFTSLAGIGFVSLVTTAFCSGYKLAEWVYSKTDHENKEGSK